eukprot:m.45645 g.45645  ORF g.45645 m.45645 type:complete len:300 (-) comp14687_c0_seq2:214-1113(-)
MDEWVAHFRTMRKENPDTSTAINAIRTLIEFLRASNATTLSELRNNIQEVINALTKCAATKITSVSSGCELFLRFITLKADYTHDFADCKRQLIDSGEIFLKKATQGRQKIAPKGERFIRDGATILTHSRSRVVEAVLLAAASNNKRFSVLVTETRPSCSGLEMAERLKQAGIPTTVIPDSAVGYVTEKVDFAVVGAEAVVESGGIINTIGTYQMALVLKAANKPFYAVAESFKFVRLYPLSQADVPPLSGRLPDVPEGIDTMYPCMDYTPPSYITLLFTDIGVLTPSAVSDELIKLYF